MKRVLTILMLWVLGQIGAQAAIINAYGRNIQLLNGKWDAIIDPYDMGQPKRVFDNRHPTRAEEFFEYSFEGGLRLNVPGDWNSQLPEFKYYEGPVWYARHIAVDTDGGLIREEGERIFLYFGAVSTRCDVYLNGQIICSHEGGFTPFETEVTTLLKPGDNFLCIKVDNRRRPDAIPAMVFDWWSYGGITRDVMLVRLPSTYIRDYFVRLSEKSDDRIRASVELSDAVSAEVRLDIPALGISQSAVSDESGKAEFEFRAKKLKLWSPDEPTLYDVIISSGQDVVSESIGFRRISVEGTKILVNGKPTFMKGVNFHEEIPQRMGRACTEADANMILSEVKALGANFIRTAHYPQNEHIVRLAEKLGLIIWEEIPLWQGIDFEAEWTYDVAKTMLTEMIGRDKNRCAIGFWSIANETSAYEARDIFLTKLLAEGRALDSSRLFTAAFYNVNYSQESGQMEMDDNFADLLDVIGINKYYGWYNPWPIAPEDLQWNVKLDKPLIVSEFGAEALYGQSGDMASSWSEDYQEKVYLENIKMFENIPNLAGTSPWVLFDFRSPFRFHPTNQDGWNRKGLVSDQGQRKKAWYVMYEYYKGKTAL